MTDAPLPVSANEGTLGVLLFGSRARGDAREASDVDLLFVTDEPFPRTERVGALSLAFYPWARLVALASAGDLFAAHLVHEAKAVHDPLDLLTRLRGSFVAAADYGRDVRLASDHGRMLIALADRFEDLGLLNRRIAWVVRTVLIARQAALGRFVFAADELVDANGARRFLPLIAAKEDQGRVEGLPQLLSEFLDAYGEPTISLRDADDVGAYREAFEAEGNIFALKTLRMLDASWRDCGYRD